ncbi:MAG TPA: GNAT family N-acetyltransferase [Propionibacteriaceae bacterium]|nr:GNAT family N-acetyltransferase [Propionibacteriaceae bacterium]
MSTTDKDVAELLTILDDLGASVVVAGGWGIDALLGHPSRAHRDLDLLISEDHVRPLINELLARGWVVVNDTAPVRIELSDATGSQCVDLHPARPDGAGGWRHISPDGDAYDYPAETLVTGHIAGREVTCLASGKQLELHQGYSPRPVDHHDLSVLNLVDLLPDDPDQVDIEVCTPTTFPSADELVTLYTSVGWTAYAREPETLHAAVVGSARVVTARLHGRLVGLARVISDGATICYLQDVLVHPDVQGHGLGRQLVVEAFAPYDKVRQKVLITDDEPGQRAFYQSLGFSELRDTGEGTLRGFVRFS